MGVGFYTSFQVIAFQSFQVLPHKSDWKVAFEIRAGAFEAFEPIPQRPGSAVTNPLVPIET